MAAARGRLGRDEIGLRRDLRFCASCAARYWWTRSARPVPTEIARAAPN